MKQEAEPDPKTDHPLYKLAADDDSNVVYLGLTSLCSEPGVAMSTEAAESRTASRRSAAATAGTEAATVIIGSCPSTCRPQLWQTEVGYEPKRAQGEFFERLAKEYLATEMEGPSKTTMAQGLLLLSERALALGDNSKGWNYAGMVRHPFFFCLCSIAFITQFSCLIHTDIA